MDRLHDAARLLLTARRKERLQALPDAMRPRDEADAYAIQRAIMAELGPIGGWKVGSPRPDGPVNCAPLPASGVMNSPGHAASAGLRGVEAEIGVRFTHDLPPRDAPYTEAEVRAAIGSAHPIIEVLDSRFTDPDTLDPLTMLADSLSHAGLVVGPAIAGWEGIDFATETVRVMVNGTAIKTRTGNPAGDMLRLLVWMANTGARWAGGLRAGQVVTTGSWTAKDMVPAGAAVTMAFARCGEVSVQFAP